MNYAQTLDYLYGRLPMFTRVGPAALKPGLDNIIALCNHLGNPQHSFKTIHIAGTNGKGSTSHMLAAILQKSGYKTGLYTSPHLKDFRERIRVDGKMVPEDFITGFVGKNQQFIEKTDPSFFEVTVAMAFEHFANEKVDVAVIEVGLGGRLDSTNIIYPDLSIITNISLDHTNLLGNTLPEIAAEKAGIIKPGVPVIIGEAHPETRPVFLERALRSQSDISFADHDLNIKYVSPTGLLNLNVYKGSTLLYKDLELDLNGIYQQKNILTVIQATEKLKTIGYQLTENAIRIALKDVKGITGLQGRWQTIETKPLIICDTGHNEAGITEILKNIQLIPYKGLHFVLGMVKDKDVSKVLSLLPQSAHYYFCAPALERAMPAELLREKAAAAGLEGSHYHTVEDAFRAAKLAASPYDLIFVGGSTFVVAEVL